MDTNVVPYKRKDYAPLGEEITTAALTAYAKQHCKEAIKYLVGVFNDKDEPTKHRIRAAQLLLDRGMGRPHQSIEVSGEIHVGTGMRGLRESILEEQARREAAGPIIDCAAVYEEGDES